MSLLVRLLLVGAVTALGACATHAPGGSAQALTGDGARVVTLVPSFADDMYAIGAGSQLVGVSAFTDAPRAKDLPRVADASSIDDEAIVALRPGVVIGIPAQERFTEPLRRAHLRVVLLPDDTYQQIFENLKEIGALTGRTRKAQSTISRLQGVTAALQSQTRDYLRHPSVFIVLGSGPIWTAGADSYIATLIRLAGGTNAASDLHGAYGQYSAEALLRRQPDLLVADAAIHLGTALGAEPWRSLRAVRLGRVYAVNPDLLERPGPAYNDGLRWLIDRIRPLAIATH